MLLSSLIFKVKLLLRLTFIWAWVPLNQIGPVVIMNTIHFKKRSQHDIITSGLMRAKFSKMSSLKLTWILRIFKGYPWKALESYFLTFPWISYLDFQNFGLELASKFEGFQGYPWKTLEMFWVASYLKTLEILGEGYPWPWLTLEIQLQGQGTLKFKATIAPYFGIRPVFVCLNLEF